MRKLLALGALVLALGGCDWIAERLPEDRPTLPPLPEDRPTLPCEETGTCRDLIGPSNVGDPEGGSGLF